MNSSEGLKGFVTFLILVVIVTLSVFGINLVINSSNSESDASSNDKSFSPADIKVETSPNSAKIQFKTDVDLLIQLEYSESSDFATSQIYDESTSNKEHFIELVNLTPSTSYYYRLKSKEKTYPESNYLRFDTLEKPTEVKQAQQDQKIEESPIVDGTEPKIETQIEKDKNITKKIFDTILDQNSKNPSSTNSGDTTQDDYSGFDQPLEYDPEQKTLGAKTNIIGESITKEFKEALIYQDLRYDFNNDKQIDAEDYPLFIKFIMDQN